ncbi:lanthionine synthetase-like protein [Terracoccus luteus]|uniref:Lanthionine synthetase-like protein n=1 Tax=Terracoccus luteus TaxID=53356 RepID=A0A495XWM7_9MICO|nr:lanthionine synthetase LanC family protein [Terracoccus luteus]RKT78981.1 lanthionine synthetase-like protein [Terracoccus luteus]
MGTPGSDRAAVAEDLARRAVDWLVAAREQQADRVSTVGSDPDPSLYSGDAGVLLALHEAAEHTGSARLRRLVDEGADRLAAQVDDVDVSSLYFGLTGIAFTLHVLMREDAAAHALRLVRSRAVDGRWGPMFELLAGNAGIALGALRAGDHDLAVAAVEHYLSEATPTASGVNWAVRPTPARSHHVAHGTLGIVLALGTVGSEVGRGDLVELALRGAADVVGRDEQGPEGFLVPHSDPPHRPDLIERYSLGWCNGPAGDAQTFRLLHQVTGDDRWRALGDRCWHTVVTSGLPARLRPGFWDNSGRCCGTAGVLALALDRVVERGDHGDHGGHGGHEDPGVFADVLVDDLLARATVDEDGARWSNHEHRDDPPDLRPERGWAMGSAGIVRELLRYARVRVGRDDAYAVPWPDHPTRPRRHPAGILGA